MEHDRARAAGSPADQVAPSTHGGTSTDAEIFFRAHLAGIDEPASPFGVVAAPKHEELKRGESTLEPELASLALLQARRSRLNVEVIFHAAWTLVVAVTSAKRDVIFGTRLSFHDALPFRMNLQGLTAHELLEGSGRQLAELRNYQHTPHATILSCSGFSEPGPLFTAALHFRRVDSPRGIVPAPESKSALPLELTVDQRGKAFGLIVQSHHRIEPLRVVGYMQTAVQALLAAAMRAPHTAALSISILPRSERQQMLESFNDVQAPFPNNKTVHELFEAQVQRTPDALAVECDGRVLTYAELNGAANQLARYLIARGLTLDQCIPIHMTRSSEMLVTQLAVLKGGGVYVPVDPDLPEERR